MWAVVGLGNPGASYERTRHNMGFLVVDALVDKYEKFARWKSKSKLSFINLDLSGNKCLVIKPLSYMNLSGEAALPLIRYYRIFEKNVILVYDDLDLEPGRVRVKVGGGDGGHKGVSNFISHFGKRDFIRIRVGIGRPSEPREDVVSWVLGVPSEQDSVLMADAVKRAVMAIEFSVTKGIQFAQRSCNKK